MECFLFCFLLQFFDLSVSGRSFCFLESIALWFVEIPQFPPFP